MPTTSNPATAMRYRDVAAAADWLCSAFGFEKQTALADDAGAILYAQLTFGRALIMLAPVGDTPIEKFMKQPDEIGGAETQSCYFVVEDADAHHARSKAAGAQIILDVQEDGFGGRGYTCRDPEGHIWSFGTYDPWQGKFPLPELAPAPAFLVADTATDAVNDAGAGPGGGRRLMLGGLTAAAIVTVGVAAWFGGALTTQSSADYAREQSLPKASPAMEASLAAAEAAAREARAQFEKERAAKTTAEKASEEAQKRAAEAHQSREAAERAARQAKADLERATKAAAGPAAEAMKRIEEESRAREAAEKSARQARAELEKAHAAKTAAEMAKEFALGRAEEEQLAREAAEKARAELERQLKAAKAGEGGAGATKVGLNLQKALDDARKQTAEEIRAREEADSAAREARDLLAKEQAAKAAAWRVIGQLTKQLKAVQSGESGAADGPPPPPKKYRPRPKKVADPEQ
jgi:uncharacterized glyoxalase superfamily protein PhnB